MTTPDWNAIAREFSAIRDARRDTVFPILKQMIRRLRPRALLDYGGGDGEFAVSISDLRISRVVVYDPSPNMTAIASENCAGVPTIEICGSASDISKGSFDVVTLNAVWMTLRTARACRMVLNDIHRLLRRDGLLLASVTHPCFRDRRFSTYRTEFDMADYTKSGKQFTVHIEDQERTITIVDTHWSLAALVGQLYKAGFCVVDVAEPADRADGVRQGCPWLVLQAAKQHQPLRKERRLAGSRRRR